MRSWYNFTTIHTRAFHIHINLIQPIHSFSVTKRFVPVITDSFTAVSDSLLIYLLVELEKPILAHTTFFCYKMDFSLRVWNFISLNSKYQCQCNKRIRERKEEKMMFRSKQNVDNFLRFLRNFQTFNWWFTVSYFFTDWLDVCFLYCFIFTQRHYKDNSENCEIYHFKSTRFQC